MNWMNLKRKMEALAHDLRCAIHGVAPEPLTGPPDQTQPIYQPLRSRRAERIRSWRRRALSRKGAQLYSAMRAGSQTGSLAMLDEGGMVVAWYERADSASWAEDRVVDIHMSQFYVAEDQALGVPVRDLCSAAIHGRSTQVGWRRSPRGDVGWATTVIEPIWLRDGRLQGFSHVTSQSLDAPQNMDVEKPKLTLHLQRIRSHAVAHSTAMLVVLALMIAGDFAHAREAVADSLPQYARKADYGSGWECISGYHRTDDGCARVIVPAHAYLDASGNNWSCKRGYRNTNNACVEVRVPSNAYLDDSYGEGWRCRRGYREVKGACAAIKVPANAHAVDSSYGSGWECDRGFQLASEACVAVVVPANGYLTNRGDDWKCDHGFNKVGTACAAVAVPANGYLDRQGNSWNCERGFSRGTAACDPIQLPENSHLSYSGDNWRCDSGFSRQAERCIRE